MDVFNLFFKNFNKALIRKFKSNYIPIMETKRGSKTSIQTNNKNVILNRFELKEHICSGSFGSVYLAFDLKTNVLLALKLEKNSSMNTLSKEVKILKELAGC